MAHAREECCFRFIGLLRSFQSFSKSLILFQRIAHFLVDYGKSEADSMDGIIVTFIGMTFARHTDHLVIFFSVSLCEIAVYDNEIICQSLTDVIRIYELKESVAVAFCNRVIRIFREELIVREMNAFCRLFLIRGIGSVADGIIFIEIDMVNATVI